MEMYKLRQEIDYPTFGYENSSVDWSINFNQPTYEQPEVEEFYNPAPDHSIRPGKFLENFDTDFKIPGYRFNTKHFHFPIESMLKLIPFKRLMGIRWDTVLA